MSAAREADAALHTLLEMAAQRGAERALEQWTTDHPTSPGEPEPKLDRVGVSRYLSISVAQVDRLSRRQHDPLPWVLVGESRRYDRRDVDAWCARQAPEAGK